VPDPPFLPLPLPRRAVHRFSRGVFPVFLPSPSPLYRLSLRGRRIPCAGHLAPREGPVRSAHGYHFPSLSFWTAVFFSWPSQVFLTSTTPVAAAFFFVRHIFPLPVLAGCVSWFPCLFCPGFGRSFDVARKPFGYLLTSPRAGPDPIFLRVLLLVIISLRFFLHDSHFDSQVSEPFVTGLCGLSRKLPGTFTRTSASLSMPFWMLFRVS